MICRAVRQRPPRPGDREPKIVDYKVLMSGTDYESGRWELEAEVKEHLESGWILQGGVSMIKFEGHAYGNDYEVIRFAQAMIKYGENE